MSDGDIITSAFEKWINGRLHLSLPLAFSNPLSCFFGFCNAPPTFQMFMNYIFADMIAEKWLKIYMDYLGIHTKEELELHHQQTCQVLFCLRAHGLSLKFFKCSFDTPTMEYLGMIIGQGLVCMDPAKLSAIKEWHPPSSVKGVHSLGFANFYHKFIPNYPNIVTPIVLLTQKDHPWSWTNAQQKAFYSLHSIFSSAPILCIPDVSHPFSLMIDASPLAAGTVLMQPDASGDLHPCAYFLLRTQRLNRFFLLLGWAILTKRLTSSQ